MRGRCWGWPIGGCPVSCPVGVSRGCGASWQTLPNLAGGARHVRGLCDALTCGNGTVPGAKVSPTEKSGSCAYCCHRLSAAHRYIWSRTVILSA